MIRLDLNKEEEDILLKVLESYLSDLTMEISDTDRLDYREILKERRRTISKVVEALKGAGRQENN